MNARLSLAFAAVLAAVAGAATQVASAQDEQVATAPAHRNADLSMAVPETGVWSLQVGLRKE